MAEQATKRLSYQAYLELERTSEDKHEWYDGRILAMAGGTPNHAAIGTNLTALFRNGLRGSPCRPWNSDLRVRIPETGLATYPDLSIVCGGLETHPEDPDAATNPTALFEVLSKSTEAYDRGSKFRDHYATLTSLRHYVLVAQYEQLVEHWQRNDDGTWNVSHLRAGDTLRLLGAEIPIEAVYEDAEILPEEALPKFAE